jgi:hypothetical protein
VKVGKSPNDLPETYRNVAKNNGNRRSTTLADGNCRIGSFGPDFRGSAVHESRTKLDETL